MQTLEIDIYAGLREAVFPLAVFPLEEMDEKVIAKTYSISGHFLFIQFLEKCSKNFYATFCISIF